MDHGLETDVAAAASLGGYVGWRRKHALPPGSACFNCGTKLLGPWCYQCGQLGEDYHRSAHHLIGEAIEGLFHADGRLWHTLPRLLISPAALTRDYLAGKRAPQVPPLRVFFVVLLLVFVAGEIASSRGNVHFVDLKIDPGDKAQLLQSQVHIFHSAWDAPLTAWLRAHVGQALDHPDAFVAAMGAWAHDFAFLSLPLSGLLLSMLFVFRRRFVLFDHLVFSMHSLSFQGLLFVVAMAGNALVSSDGAVLFWLSPVHLFAHMRGVYGTSIVGTLVRMAILFTLSVTVFAVLMLGLVVVGLATLKT
jgi:hypothetical protein